MKIKHSLLTLGALLGAATVSNATIIGFAGVGGNNDTIPAGLGSNPAADGTGFTVANGATPNIALTWDSGWDIHRSRFFGDIEAQTVGDVSWDGESSTTTDGINIVAQLDFGNHTIRFAAEPGFAVVLNSFDFGHTPETPGSTEWELTLTDSNSVIVWQANVLFNNGEANTYSPNFTGDDGESYLLTFNRTNETYGSNGRHALDNLNFNQVVVPEPGSAALLGIAGLSLLLRRRK